MLCFLALECSLTEGSLALLEFDKNKQNILCSTKWKSYFNGRFIENAHSDKLPLEIHKALKKSNKKLSDLDFLALGVGPGRWTGLRASMTVIRSLSFCLKIPVCPVNSLRICAEAALPYSSPVFTAINAFKNQVYFAKFYAQQNKKTSIKLWEFPSWLNYMEKQKKEGEGKALCLSDLEDFYPIPQSLKKAFCFKKIKAEALNLAKIVIQQKDQGLYQDWSQLKAFYLKNPLEEKLN